MRRVARTLAEVAQVLAASDGSHDRVVAVLTLLNEVVAYEHCALLEVVPKRSGCELFTVPELPALERAALRQRLVALLHLMSDEGGDAESLPPDGVKAAVKAHLALPVIGLNHIIGVLYVEQAGDEYDEHSLRLLTVVAAQLGSYLTTLRLREEEVEHARQLGAALHRLEETDRRKDEFLAMLGHELRNPLGAINNALRVLDQGPGPTHPVERYHRVIDRQIAHLSRIVDDLLDASRVRLGKIVLDHHAVDLRLVAERWLEAFGTTGPVRARDLRLELPDAPVIVDGDPVRLEQIVSNLLTNALKYTPAGGRIDLTVGVEDGRAVIRVRDSGIGMTPEVLATVFDLFTQADESLARSQGGLGLGLPLVRSLVERHHGTVDAYSDGLGKGSELVVRLPLASGMATLRPPRPVAQPPARALRILVVEDNDDVRETMGEMLSLWGHQVEEARDGIEALARIGSGPYDVLLLDIGLPKLDGYSVARRVREQLGDGAPMMLAMTGYGQPEDRRRAIDAGFDAHMVKPVDAVELRQRLASVQDGRKA
jgi:signal transduction histidine kinase/ActR/RegA family two-component response regulator